MLSHRIDARRSLRPYEEADADALQALIEANREHLASWMPWAARQQLEGTLAFIRSSRAALADNSALELAILVDGAIVGGAGLNRVDRTNRLANIGYWIAADAQGRGTVTAAARALIDHAFDGWRLNRVEIRAGVGNHRSRAVAERLGFEQEGVLRQAELVGDRFIDHSVYAMLAADWQAERIAQPRAQPAQRSARGSD
ncbi:MAG: GNAT family N-acetyltransferase [Solirubrobacteraceae bacterium]